MTNLRQSYYELVIINMLIFERSYDDFMILSYDKLKNWRHWHIEEECFHIKSRIHACFV